MSFMIKGLTPAYSSNRFSGSFINSSNISSSSGIFSNIRFTDLPSVSSLGTNSSGIIISGSGGGGGPSFSQSITYTSGGAQPNWTVPTGTYQVLLNCIGGGGAGGPLVDFGAGLGGGGGAGVIGIRPVLPGYQLSIFVGTNGNSNTVIRLASPAFSNWVFTAAGGGDATDEANGAGGSVDNISMTDIGNPGAPGVNVNGGNPGMGTGSGGGPTQNGTAPGGGGGGGDEGGVPIGGNGQAIISW